MKTNKETNASQSEALQTHREMSSTENRYQTDGSEVDSGHANNISFSSGNAKDTHGEKRSFSELSNPTCSETDNAKYSEEERLRDKIKWTIRAKEIKLESLKNFLDELPSGKSDNFYHWISI